MNAAAAVALGVNEEALLGSIPLGVKEGAEVAPGGTNSFTSTFMALDDADGVNELAPKAPGVNVVAPTDNPL